MNTEFAFLSFSKTQLNEVYQAVLTQYLVEEQLRREQDLESVEPPALLEQLQTLLGMNDERAHTLFHEKEDELWEYSWFRYTDEWAWFRARQDVLRELDKRISLTKRRALDEMIEERYTKNFETYVAEIGMEEDQQQKKSQRKRKQQPKG